MQLIISYDSNDNTVYGEILISDTEEEVSPATIKSKLDEAGYSNIQIDPQAVNKLCAQAQKNEPIKLALKVLIDAKAEVEISSDKKQASISLTPADGGKNLTAEGLKQVIVDAGVEEAMVDWDSVKRLHEQGKAKDVRIAVAVLPVNGKDAVYTPLVESEINKAPKVDENGVADMLSGHSFTIVEPGQSLMRKEPATEGEAGKDVTGELIKPVPGKDLGFAKNIEGADLSPDDENLLIATIKGHPIQLKNGVSVDPVLHVDDVYLQTGNITFDGSLEVKGDVAAGMTIDVTGDVIVKGAVERACIYAGNDIVVRGGIFGGDELEEGEEGVEYSIQAGGSIDAGFLNIVAAKAGKDIIVKQYIGNSYVYAGERLLLGQNGGKGVLFGGRTKALHSAAIAQLGNESYLETVIDIGELHHSLERYKSLKADLKARSSEDQQLSVILEKVEKQNPEVMGKVSVDKAKRIKKTIQAIKDKIVETNKELKVLAVEMEKQKKANLAVTKKVFPNANIAINGVRFLFQEERRGDVWTWINGKLICESEGN